MFNRTNKTDKRNQKNKGFSLVELIVVIAIMAVLVAVLAPQFTKYIDQSRKSNDAVTVSGIVTAAQVGVADTSFGVTEGTYKITIDESEAKITSSDGDADAMSEAIKAACGDLSELEITSKNWLDDNTDKTSDVTVTLTYKGGAVTVTYEGAFKTYIEGTEKDK